jgi:hypothetical protein
MTAPIAGAGVISTQIPDQYKVWPLSGRVKKNGEVSSTQPSKSIVRSVWIGLSPSPP